MSNGVLLFANNNEQVDYVKQAVYSAKLIKQNLGCEVAIASDCADYVRNGFPKYSQYIDHVIDVDESITRGAGQKRFRDGTMAEKTLQWKNTNRYSAYDITPFDQTIVLDTDVLINNGLYNHCWNQPEDFLIDKVPVDVHPTRNDNTFKRISDKSIDFYWATAFFFRKTETTKLLFDTIQHVIDNYDFYRMMYQIIPKKLRNDFVFSIAIHILNGFKFNSQWPRPMPTRMYMTTDCDILYQKNGNRYTFFLDKETHPGQYTINSVADVNLHVMNKFSLGRVLDEEMANE
jgi:hypothetical protein